MRANPSHGQSKLILESLEEVSTLKVMLQELLLDPSYPAGAGITRAIVCYAEATLGGTETSIVQQ